MKKIIYTMLFILISVNLSANMMGDSQRSPHRMRPYMMDIDNKEDLSQEQYEELMRVRMEFMKKGKYMNARLREIRGEMNHCMMKKDEESEGRYKRLRDERGFLMKERDRMKKEFKEEISNIIKKQ